MALMLLHQSMANYPRTGLELQYFSLLGMFPTFITTQGFSTNMSIYLIAIINA